MRIADEYPDIDISNTTRDIDIGRTSQSTTITVTYMVPWKTVQSRGLLDILRDTIGTLGYGGKKRGGDYTLAEGDLKVFLNELNRQLRATRAASFCGSTVVVLEESDDHLLVLNSKPEPRDPRKWLNWEPAMWIHKDLWKQLHDSDT
jgi:hypothetical protein